MRLRVTSGRVTLDLDDPALRLTEEQKQALGLGREIVVTAGAGAGKTHTLALRYASLFLDLAHGELPEIDAVAVLTFTEKAAAEMAERCYQRLLSVAAAVRARRTELDALDGPGGRPLGAHLTTALDRLCDRFDRARIGTFHGFCARVLRDFPAACETPIDVRVLDPVEAASHRLEALETTLLDALRADPDGFGALLDAFGSRRRLVDAGRIALERAAELEPTLLEHAAGLRTLADRIARAAWTSERAAARLDEARGALSMMDRLLQPGSGRWRTESLRPVLASLAEPEVDGEALALWRFAACRAVLDLLVSDGRLRTLTHPAVMGRKDGWPDAGRYRQAKRALEVLADRLARWAADAAQVRELPTQADATLLTVLQPFSRWVLAARERFRHRLAEKGAIDFDAMQARAVRAVVAHADVRDALVRRHRYLVVDEFQDTDARQWALVRAITQCTGTPDRVFLVGDAKQAIYGFRGGDVTVFRNATAELGTTPIVLPHNFRSRPELIAWFNDVFPVVLAPAGPVPEPFEAPYEPLIAGRAEPGGSITAVLGDPGDEATDADAAAHLIAAEILPGKGAYARLDATDREQHPAPPIAILLRRRTHMAAYEEALRVRGVPFAVATGVGFWSRPEVVDLINALHGLATGDPVSVVGALRSPLFGLSDQDLTDLRGPERLRAFGSGDPPAAGISTAWNRWADLTRQARWDTPAGLLRALVAVARGHWPSAGPAPGRAEANAQRLVALATDLQARLGLHGCAEHFLAQVLAGTREAEAALAPDRARVLLLTIHAAKGLEFPVVLVPEIDVPPRPETAALAVGRPGGPERWELAFAVSDEASDVQRRVRPGLLEAVQRAARAEADAEGMRLLYVAATRARDHLVLLGTEPGAPRARPTWIERLLPDLPASTRVIRRSVLLAEPMPTAPPTTRPSLPAEPARAVARTPRIEINASSLDRLASCPARWFRSQRLGIPEALDDVEDRARAMAGLRGQVLHGLLEDDVAEDERTAEQRWTAALLDAGFSLDDAAAGLSRLHAHRTVAVRSEALQRALAAPGHSELGFLVAHGLVALRGQIDRLYQGPHGWTVLDYKTEAVRDAAERAPHHRRQLLAYAWAADRVLRAQGLPGVARAELFFTATGETVALVWDDGARGEVEDLLERAGTLAQRGWSEVEALALADREPRPCASCGYRGRGCMGQPEPAVSAPEP